MTTLGQLFPRFLKNPSPWILAASCVTALIWRLTIGVYSWVDLAIIVGITVYWPLHEWLLHVFTLHAKTELWYAKAHREHHKDPFNLDLVFIPTFTYVLLPLMWAPPLLVAPTHFALTGLAWYFALSLNYEWIHFLTHTRYAPKGWWYKRLWTNHRLHHFKNEHYWYGVTMLSGDKLLNTAPDPTSTPLSPTARDIGASQA